MLKRKPKVLTPEQVEEIRTKDFFDMILPGTIKFLSDHYIVGDSYRCVWAIREYPPSTEEQAILSQLADRNGVTLRIYHRLVESMEQRKIIQNATRRNRLKSGGNDVSESIEAEGNLQDVIELLANLRKNKEPLLHVSVFIELKAKSMEKLKELQSDIAMELTRSKISVDRLTLRQKEGFLSVLPVGANQFGAQYERVLPASSVANMYPFNFSGKTDPHGSYIGRDKYGTNIIVILGDVGANYGQDERDAELKYALNKLKPIIFCIHGNHEIRPWHIPTYKTKEWHGGIVWYEEAYPSVLFARDGEIYDLEGLRHIVIGGAYSVDKFYRLSRGYGWWSDEQPSEEIKQYVEQQLKENVIDVVLSHTCPFKYEPVEEFLPGIDQSTVDDSTEKWLDVIEETTDYIAWFCGHWHTNKRIDKMHFLFHQFESSESIQELKVMKEMTDEDMRKVIGNYNTLVTFSVRYALGRSTLAPGTMKRIIKDSLGALHEQTKQGILRDIEDYIEQHETVDALGEWQQTMKMLRDDLERKKKDG